MPNPYGEPRTGRSRAAGGAGGAELGRSGWHARATGLWHASRGRMGFLRDIGMGILIGGYASSQVGD